MGDSLLYITHCNLVRRTLSHSSLSDLILSHAPPSLSCSCPPFLLTITPLSTSICCSHSLTIKLPSSPHSLALTATGFSVLSQRYHPTHSYSHSRLPFLSQASVSTVSTVCPIPMSPTVCAHSSTTNRWLAHASLCATSARAARAYARSKMANQLTPAWATLLCPAWS